MESNSWKKQSNEVLKKKSSIYIVANKIELYCLRFYFVLTILSLLVLGFLAYKYLGPYFNLFVENKESILNFLNETVR